jgi:hypothetical protein
MKTAKFMVLDRLKMVSVALGIIAATSLGVGHVEAQQAVDSFQLVKKWTERATHFEIDKLGQIYLATANNDIIKYSTNGKELFRYNNNTRGDIYDIEATDPFNVLLFYKDFQAVATLDRTMNERALMLLYSGDIFNASAIALARDNNLWVYDQAAFSLQKLSADGTVLVNSGNLSAQLDDAPVITQMVARDNWVYMLSPEKGVFIFDNFTQFHQLLPFTNYEEIYVMDDLILLYKPDEALVYHRQRRQSLPLAFPGNKDDFLQLRWQKDQYYILSKDGILRQYSIVLPGKQK